MSDPDTRPSRPEASPDAARVAPEAGLEPRALALDAPSVAALELLSEGALAPLSGFSLAAGDGLPSLPLYLDRQPAAPGDTLALQDAEGVTLAVLRVTETGEVNGRAACGGELTATARPCRELFADRRSTSPAIREALSCRGAGPGTCISLRGGGDLERLPALPATGPVLLRVMDDGDPDHGHQLRQRVESADALASRLGAQRCVVAVSPDPTPDAGDHQSRVDALYARNMGCETHLAATLPGARPQAGAAGGCVFFTGLSGSGKSTLARALHARLVQESGRAVTLLDGDVVRRHLSRGLGFSREDRDLNILRIGYVASRVVMHGGLVICAPIAPFARTREQVRSMVEAHGHFVEVHVSTPLAACEARDRKGLYARARAGEIPAFTGISDPYEAPERPDLRVDTSDVEVAEAVSGVMQRLREREVV